MVSFPTTAADGSLVFLFRGSTYFVPYDPAQTLNDLAQRLATLTGAANETVKLLQPGSHGKGLVPALHPTVQLAEAGIQPDSRFLLLASTENEVQSIKAAKDLPGLADFDHEFKREMRRRSAATDATPSLPTGPYTFQAFETWDEPGLSPPPGEALKLLKKLSSDRGIVDIMTRHKWTVGLLAEMPPEGKVGISAVCILGYNTNQGQSIHLRLRTDDLRGLRNYQRIRETLIHELAHNVWSDHDNNFKQLNSQLLRECEQLDQRGALLLGALAYDAPVDPDWVDDDDVMAVAKRSSGRTLGDLAGLSSTTPEEADARVAAAKAAILRLGQDSEIQGVDHYDPSTAAAEDAMRKLGTASGAAGDSADNNAAPVTAASIADHQRQGSGKNAATHTTHHQGERSSSAAPNVCTSSTQVVHRSTQVHNVQPSVPSLDEQPHDAPGATTEMDVDDSAASPDASRNATSLEHPSKVPCSNIKDACCTADSQGSDERAWLGTPGVANATSASNPETTSHLLSSREEGTCPSQPDPTTLHTSATGQSMAVDSDIPFEAREGPEQAGVPELQFPAELDMVSDLGLDPSDPVVAQYQRIAHALRTIWSHASPADAVVVLQTLAKILHNALNTSNDAKFRRIRQNNGTFYSRAGRFPGAVELLQAAGFAREEGQEPVLFLRRNDPGLVLLTLSAVEQSLSAVQTNAHMHAH